MIDNGFAFNGPHWDFPESAVQGLYHRRMVYESVRSLDDFCPWLDQLVHFPEDRAPASRPGFVALMIDRALASNLPPWASPDPAVQGLYHRRMVYESVRSLDDFCP